MEADSGTRWRTGINSVGKWYAYQPDSGGYDSVSALVISPGTGNAVFAGTVSDNSGPLMSKRGLISTLSTLRQATQNETTLEGLRDSIDNAIGGLIENLEHEISTMPAEGSE